jgi:hypothetical protein
MCDIELGINVENAQLVVKECTDEMYTIIAPDIFKDGDPKDVTHKIDDSFENLYFILETESGNIDVTTLSTYSFYKRVEIIQKRSEAQERAISKSKNKK